MHHKTIQAVQNKCSSNHPSNALYLKPVPNPAKNWFYSCAKDHNILGLTVKQLSQKAGFQGHFTNHSLRATAATYLFKKVYVDEKLNMYHRKNPFLPHIIADFHVKPQGGHDI